MHAGYRTHGWLAIALCLASCYRLPPPSPRVSQLPAKLSQTGLYADAGMASLAPGVRPYRPAYQLWSDGADKARFISLPPQAQIDSSNMDDWQLPVGTRIWKEFTRDGVRVETRLLQRVSTDNDGWAAAAYAWDREGHDAALSLAGQQDALGTPHDIPEARACAGCHAGRASFVLGFSALQLSHDAGTGDELTLERLAQEGLLSTAAAPLQVPGNATTSAALGYLHANCGHCHNSARPSSARFLSPPNELDLWLRSDSLADVRATNTYRTVVPDFVDPEEPSSSALIKRMDHAGLILRRMPPVATERPDAESMSLVKRWIASLR